MPSKPRTLRVLSIRIDLDSYERLVALAEEERRSINAQIQFLIDSATK